MSFWKLSGLLAALCMTMACDAKPAETKPSTPPVKQDSKPAKPPATTPPPADAELSDAIKESRKYGHVPISGKTTRAAVLEKFGTWQAKMKEVTSDADTAKALAKVKPGAEVTVVFGSWCKDCYDTLPVVWKTFDAVEGELPFTVEYIALDESFQAKDVDLAALDIRNIPTIIVKRDGKESGRFIEKAEGSAAQELLALLNGSKTGVISTNAKIRKAYDLK